MDQLKQWDTPRIIGAVVIGIVVIGLVNSLIFPLLNLGVGVLWSFAGLVSGLLRLAIFLGLIGAMLFGLAHLLGLTK